MLGATYRVPVLSNMFMFPTMIPVRISIAPSPDTTHSHISAQTNYHAERQTQKGYASACPFKWLSPGPTIIVDVWRARFWFTASEYLKVSVKACLLGSLVTMCYTISTRDVPYVHVPSGMQRR